VSEQKQPLSNGSDFYRVIEEEPACPHCKSGASYAIVYTEPDGEECATGTTYGGPADDEAVKEHVEEIAEDLNRAFQLGRASQQSTGEKA
jgi:hypothetical protein